VDWVGGKEEIVPPAGPSLLTIMIASGYNEALFLVVPPTAFGMATMIEFGNLKSEAVAQW
jgi:hypothetical protein